jgi:YidC/Oxa1 family membrane protein insertase
MALYKEHGVNPASGCLPLLLQAPIFFALFRVLQTEAEVKTAEFYLFTSNVSLPARPDPLPTDFIDPTGLGASPMNAGWAGWLLVLLIAGTMFVTQKQMMARRSAGADDQTTQQQRIMLYVMPVFLGAISINLPLGVLLYWVTTNLWQFAQQAVILKEVEADPGDASAQGAKRAPHKGPPGGTGAEKPPRARGGRSGRGARPEPSSTPKPKPKPRGRPDHLPGGKRSGR